MRGFKETRALMADDPWAPRCVGGWPSIRPLASHRRVGRFVRAPKSVEHSLYTAALAAGLDGDRKIGAFVCYRANRGPGSKRPRITVSVIEPALTAILPSGRHSERLSTRGHDLTRLYFGERDLNGGGVDRAMVWRRLDKH